MSSSQLSHPSPAPPPSQPPNPESPLPDLAALVVTLQAAAQALARYCEHAAPSALQGGEAFAPAVLEPARSGNSCKTDESCGPATTAETSATRCYRFSASALRHERELLEKYHAEDFRDLITQTNTLLVGVVKLMKSVHPDTRMRGYVVSSLGCLLEQASILTLRMHNVYSKVDVVPAPTPV